MTTGGWRMGRLSRMGRTTQRLAIPLALLILGACGGGAEPSLSARPSEAVASASGSPHPRPSGFIDVPGTHVSLRPPDGFVASSDFPGFELTDKGASILVSELPANIDELIQGLTEEALRAQGVIEVGREELTVDGWRALLIDGTQTAAGDTYSKWMLVLGGESLSAIILGTCPIDAPELREPLRISLEGAILDPDRSTDPLAALSFTLEPAPPLMFAGTISGGAAYNTSGKLPSADPQEPTLIVAPSFGPIASPRESFLTARMMSIQGKTGIELEPLSPISVGSLEGFEVTGTATDSSSGEALAVFGAVLFQGDSRYIFAVGFCRQEAAEFLPVFRSSVSSLRPKGG
jgi:hypothetical protein